MKLFRTGFPGKWLYPDAVFRIKSSEKNLYLTIDDGPDPSSTLSLLKLLKHYNIKAVFFCNGKAAKDYPDIMQQIKSDGHIIGNHGYGHLNGWYTGTDNYIADVNKAAEIISGRLFRPPYGKISLKQYSVLRQKYKLIFWDVMCYDFDDSFGKENSLRILKKKIRPGSVIVLHDTPASCANIILDEFLLFAIESGYRFELIT